MTREEQLNHEVAETLLGLRGKLHPKPHDLRFEIRPDATGDDSIFVWIELSQDAEEAWSRTEDMRSLVIESVRQAFPDYWPYISFTTPDESPPSTRAIGRAA